MWLQQIIFYAFSALLLIAATVTVLSRNPVHGVLGLVLTFFASSVLWMLLESEFLALILIVVYVGAVMTLFLFVVMMLDSDVIPKRQGFVRYLPLGVLVVTLLVSLMIATLASPKISQMGATMVVPRPATFSSVADLGAVLYTQYLLPFELSGVLLLVAMIAAISLAFRGRRNNTKAQTANAQISVKAKDRIRLVDMPSEPRGGNL